MASIFFTLSVFLLWKNIPFNLGSSSPLLVADMWIDWWNKHSSYTILYILYMYGGDKRRVFYSNFQPLVLVILIKKRKKYGSFPLDQRIFENKTVHFVKDETSHSPQYRYKTLHNRASKRKITLFFCCCCCYSLW